ncbi:MAG: HAD-IA family hydrolase [Anaerolineaceae bacterium]|nr:HAD-IA family hydrolase [Anaerolineaceae bacterium]MCB9101273.1 HAD-IA family hydrolase [Anaerolineales bacterium]
MTTLQALIFDIDGTLADTEQHGHLPACNDAFAQLGYAIRWSWDEFKAMLPIQGNALRMRHTLARTMPELSPETLDRAVADLTQLKKRLYIDKYLPRLQLRPGVEQLITSAVDRGVRLAVVSSSYEAQIEALLQYRLPNVAGLFEPLLGKESGRKTAPDSPLYRRCLAELGTKSHQTLVIEDSAVGFKAAQRAGLPCAVIYNDYTFGEDFAGAALVARSLEPFTLDQLAALCLPAEAA